MNASASRLPSHTGFGFSLIEVVCAIAIIGATILPVLGVLSIGINDGQTAWQRRSEAQMRSTVSQLLQDPAWPEHAHASESWTAEAWLDTYGALTPHRDNSAGAVRMELQALPGLGWDSPWLEAVQVKFYAGDTRILLGQCVQQRMKRVGG